MRVVVRPALSLVNVLALKLSLDRVNVVVEWIEIPGRAGTEVLLEGLTILLAMRDRALRNDIAGIRSLRGTRPSSRLGLCGPGRIMSGFKEACA